jgi:hypothetical protein
LVGGPPGIELHTVVEELPGRDVGGTFPIPVVTMGTGIAPNTPAGAIAGGGIVGAGVAVAVLAMELERLLTTNGTAGTGAGAKEGDGRGGTEGGGGAGMVVPG